MRRVTLPGKLKLFGPKTEWVEADILEQVEPAQETESEEHEGIPVVILKTHPAPGEGEAGAAREGGGCAAELPCQAAETVQAPVRPRPTGQVILVSYAGEYVGVYRSPRKIMSKTAYQTVAAIVRLDLPDFDPAKLELFRAVPLRAPDACEVLNGGGVGHFVRFDHRAATETVS